MSDYSNNNRTSNSYTDDDLDGIEFLDVQETNDDYIYDFDKDDNVYDLSSHSSKQKKNLNQPQNEEDPKQSFHEMLADELKSIIKIIAMAAIIAFVFTQFIIVNAEVPSGSMRNTIIEGDRLIGFRLAYLFSEPQRGDIVIFKYPDNEKENFVKRVIGLPNDVVQIYGGNVYVNGEKLDEPYLLEDMEDDGKEYTYIVPEGCYFMLGDNRNNSKDSRYWTNTYVKKDKIIAKVSFRYYSGAKKHLAFSLVK